METGVDQIISLVSGEADIDRESHTEPACAETHISWVLLTGDRALKIYKPVRTDVLDHRSIEDRRAACAREVALNRRLSSDVYDGVGEITLDGDSLEPVIVMRRMPATRRLSGLLDGDEAPALIRAVARRVAAFHESTESLSPDVAARVASRQALDERWAADIAGLRRLADPSLHGQIDRIGDLAHRYLEGRGDLFGARVAHGLVRDGHGDLLADDIFCLDDGPRILDCLAFCDELRWVDVLADLAFLVMDLQRLGHPTLARQLLRDYCEFSGERHPGSLAHFAVAQRALVRAKVSALRTTQTNATTSEVRTLLDLALDHLERAAVRVVLVGGLPGSGKSTLASRMSDELGWTMLSSDDIRRDLGLRRLDLEDESAYDATTVGLVYDEMCRQADQLVRHGFSVILDATWSADRHRQQARAVAVRGSAQVMEIRCQAPLATCRERVRNRSGDSTSEATPSVVDIIDDRADEWSDATVFDTSDSDPDDDHSHVQAIALWWNGTARSPLRT